VYMCFWSSDNCFVVESDGFFMKACIHLVFFLMTSLFVVLALLIVVVGG
jgi:hypothetical protein